MRITDSAQLQNHTPRDTARYELQQPMIQSLWRHRDLSSLFSLVPYYILINLIVKVY